MESGQLVFLILDEKKRVDSELASSEIIPGEIITDDCLALGPIRSYFFK